MVVRTKPPNGNGNGTHASLLPAGKNAKKAGKKDNGDEKKEREVVMKGFDEEKLGLPDPKDIPDTPRGDSAVPGEMSIDEFGYNPPEIEEEGEPEADNGKKRRMGRPTKYKKEFVKTAYNYCLLGARDKDLCRFFGVSEQTLNNWKADHPDFFEAIKAGKLYADMNVVRSFYRRAVGGYEYTETTYVTVEGGKKRKKGESAPMKVKTVVKHCPPDVTAGIFWLKNRIPEWWRERLRAEITGKDGGPIETRQEFDLSSLTDKELRMLERLIGKAAPELPTEAPADTERDPGGIS